MGNVLFGCLFISTCPVTSGVAVLYLHFFSHLTLSLQLSFVFSGVSGRKLFYTLLLFVVMVNPKGTEVFDSLLGEFS